MDYSIYTLCFIYRMTGCWVACSKNNLHGRHASRLFQQTVAEGEEVSQLFLRRRAVKTFRAFHLENNKTGMADGNVLIEHGQRLRSSLLLLQLEMDGIGRSRRSAERPEQGTAMFNVLDRDHAESSL